MGSGGINVYGNINALNSTSTVVIQSSGQRGATGTDAADVDAGAVTASKIGGCRVSPVRTGTG